MKKQILAVLLAAVMVFGLAACSKGADGTESDQKENKDENTKTSESEGDVVKLAVLLKAETDDYWTAVKTGIENWAEEEGNVQAEFFFAEAEDDYQGQAKQIEDAIDQGFDAVCVAPLSETNLVDGVLKACEKGVPVVSIDGMIDPESLQDEGGSLAGIYMTDNLGAGQRGAEFICEQIGSGQVAILEGTLEDQASNDRTQGASAYFDSQDGIEVVASQPAEWDRLIAVDVAMNIIQTNPELRAFYCCNGAMALGAQEAVINAGKEGQILVVGTDSVASAKSAVLNGEMKACVGVDAEAVGVACAKRAVEAVQEGWKLEPEGKMEPEYLESVLITDENAKE